MASRELRRRPELLRSGVLPGCSMCRDWPLIWLIGEDDQEPPTVCPRCGREAAAETRVYVGVRLADV